MLINKYFCALYSLSTEIPFITFQIILFALAIIDIIGLQNQDHNEQNDNVMAAAGVRGIVAIIDAGN